MSWNPMSKHPFRPFEYPTRSVFRSPLYNLLLKLCFTSIFNFFLVVNQSSHPNGDGKIRYAYPPVNRKNREHHPGCRQTNPIFQQHGQTCSAFSTTTTADTDVNFRSRGQTSKNNSSMSCCYGFDSQYRTNQSANKDCFLL